MLVEDMMTGEALEERSIEPIVEFRNGTPDGPPNDGWLGDEVALTVRPGDLLGRPLSDVLDGDPLAATPLAVSLAVPLDEEP